MAGEGKFRVTTLTFKVGSGGLELEVDCGATGRLDMAGNLCGQHTAQGFVRPIVGKDVEKLRTELQNALNALPK